MKKLILGILIGVLAVLCLAAADRDFFSLKTNQVDWADKTFSVVDSNAIDLAVTERTWSTITAAIAADANNDGEIQYKRIPTEWNSIRFRCIGYSDNNSVTHQIYFGTLGGETNCEFVNAGQLAWTIGTQASITSGYEFADAVTVTSYCWTKSWSSSSPGSNLVAEASIDCAGADMLVVVPTTTDCNSFLLMKGY